MHLLNENAITVITIVTMKSIHLLTLPDQEMKTLGNKS